MRLNFHNTKGFLLYFEENCNFVIMNYNICKLIIQIRIGWQLGNVRRSIKKDVRFQADRPGRVRAELLWGVAGKSNRGREMDGDCQMEGVPPSFVAWTCLIGSFRSLKFAQRTNFGGGISAGVCRLPMCSLKRSTLSALSIRAPTGRFWPPTCCCYWL